MEAHQPLFVTVYHMLDILLELLHKLFYTVLAGVAQWTECQPVNQRVASWMSGHMPGLRARGNHTLMFLSLPSPLSKNKQNL